MVALLVAALLMVPGAARAGIGLVVTASPSPARQGETLELAFTVTNDGGSTVHNVALVFAYPAGLATLSNSLFDGSCPSTNCSLSCCAGEQATITVGSIPAGQGRTYTMPVRIAAGAANGATIPMSVAAFVNGVSQTTAQTNVLVDGARQLELGMTIDRDPVAPGETFTCSVNYGVVANGGGVPVTSLQIPVPPGTSFVAASDGGMLAGGVVTWSLGGLNPGEGGARQATFAANAGLAAGSIVVAQATIDGGAVGAVSARSAVRVEVANPIQVLVTASPDPIRTGETVDLEITVSNSGPLTRTDVVLRVEVPDHVNALSNSLIDGSCASINCSLACCAQERATFAIGTLLAGKGVTFTIPWQVAGATVAGTVLSFNVDVVDSTGQMRRSGAGLGVRGADRLELAAVIDRNPVPPGATTTATLTYGIPSTNPPAAGAVLRFPIPAGMTVVSASDGGSVASGAVTWSLGVLNPGAVGERRVVLQLGAGAAAGGLLASRPTLTVSSGNRVAYPLVSRVQPTPPLGVALTARPDPVRAGELMHLELVVTNPSASDRNGVVLRLEVPDHLSTLSNALFDGSCASTNCSLACCAQERATWSIGTLPAGRGVVLTMPWIVAPGTLDGRVITFKADLSESTGERARSATSVAVRSAGPLELAIAEDRVPVAPGERLVYSIAYGVVADAPGSPNAVLRMAVPAGTTFVSASDGGVFSNGVVEWALGSLQRRATGERRMTVQVGSSAQAPAGSLLRTEAVLRDESVPPNVIACESAVRVEVANPLELAVTAGPSPAMQGELLDVEVTVTNTGAFDRTGVTLRVEVPASLQTISNTLIVDGSCPSTNCSLACCAQERVTFPVGTLKAGAGRTFSIPFAIAVNAVDGRARAIHAEVFDSQGDERRTGSVFAVNGARALGLALRDSAEPGLPGGQVTYTMTYGARADSGGAPDATLRFALPPNTTFVGANSGGTLQGGEVVWALGGVNPSAGGDRSVTVAVPAGTSAGALLRSWAILRDAAGREVRAQESTRIAAQVPLQASLQVSPLAAPNGGQLQIALAATNTGPLALSGVALALEFPGGLNTLSNSAWAGSCPSANCSNSCCAQETGTVTVGTLEPGQTATYLLQPVVSLGTHPGTVIDFDARASDASGLQSSAGAAILVGTQYSSGGGTTVPGDINGDGAVDGADLGLLLGAWGNCASCASCAADLNGNCVVDGADLGILLGNWG